MPGLGVWNAKCEPPPATGEFRNESASSGKMTNLQLSICHGVALRVEIPGGSWLSELEVQSGDCCGVKQSNSCCLFAVKIPVRCILLRNRELILTIKTHKH